MSSPPKVLVLAKSHSENTENISRVLGLAHQQEKNVTLLNVSDGLPVDQVAWATVALPQDLLPPLLNEKRLRPEKEVKASSAEHLGVETCHVKGLPFEEFMKKVNQNKYPFVVLESTTSERRKRSIFANTTARLLRDCPCIIWVASENEPKTIGCIVAMTDVYASTKQDVRCLSF